MSLPGKQTEDQQIERFEIQKIQSDRHIAEFQEELEAAYDVVEFDAEVDCQGEEEHRFEEVAIRPVRRMEKREEGLGFGKVFGILEV